MTPLQARLLCPWDSLGKNTGSPSPSPGDFPDPGIEPRCPASQADSLPAQPHPALETMSSSSLLLLLLERVLGSGAERSVFSKVGVRTVAFLM